MILGVVMGGCALVSPPTTQEPKMRITATNTGSHATADDAKPNDLNPNNLNLDEISYESQPSLWLERVVTLQPAAKSLGNYRFGLGCAGPYGPMYWSDIRRYVHSTWLREAGRQALVQAGHRPPGGVDDVLRTGYRGRPDWIIGAKITDIDADLCRDSNWLISTHQGAISGQITLHIAWQIFDNRTRQTLLRANTIGTGNLASGTRDGIAAMMEMAFADAFDRLSTEQIYPLITAQKQNFPHDISLSSAEDTQDEGAHDQDMFETPSSDDMDQDGIIPDDDVGRIKTISAIAISPPGLSKTSAPATDPLWPAAWQDNLTSHPEALLGGIFRTEPGRQPALAINSQGNKTILLTLPKPGKNPATSVRRDDGTIMPARFIKDLGPFHLLEIATPTQNLVPVFQTMPRPGQPVALISAIKGNDMLEPILTSGLIAQQDKKQRLLWLDLPRTARDTAMIVLDERGNALATTMPDNQQNGLVAAKPIDREILAGSLSMRTATD